jgi:hypothetical protein
MSILRLLVIRTVSLAITPIGAVIDFHDQMMNEMKIICMLLDFLEFCFIYLSELSS